MTDHVRYELRGHVARVTLNVPETRNALGAEVVERLGAALRRATADEAVRAIVLSGAGPVFCAGLNLKGDIGGFVQGYAAQEITPSLYQGVVKTLWKCPKPVLGRIQGSAFGAGFGLVLCCDVAIAVDSAEFAVTELHFGMPPTLIPLMLQEKQLLGGLRPLLFTGERFSAARALALHVLHSAVPAASLDGAIDEACGQLLRCAPGALATAKMIQRSLPSMTFLEGLAFAGGHLSRALSCAEATEGFAAFAEKRQPDWAV